MQHLNAAYNSLDSELRYTIHEKIVRDRLELNTNGWWWLQISNLSARHTAHTASNGAAHMVCGIRFLSC